MRSGADACGVAIRVATASQFTSHAAAPVGPSAAATGHWDEQKHLNAFLQSYAVEKAKIEARKKGHSVSEARLEDGSIRVTERVEGAA